MLARLPLLVRCMGFADVLLFVEDSPNTRAPAGGFIVQKRYGPLFVFDNAESQQCGKPFREFLWISQATVWVGIIGQQKDYQN